MRVLSLFLGVIPTASFLSASSSSNNKNTNNNNQRKVVRVDVTSACESIAVVNNECCPSNVWLVIDPSSKVEDGAEAATTIIISVDDDQQHPDFIIEECTTTTVVLPLYPLPAVYLPTGQYVEYTLNNVEPRNIQMALDLLSSSSSSDRRCFCAVLRTVDTGRFASTGTILRIVDHDQQMVHVNNMIQRITLKCIADEIVDIDSIINPDAANLEYRLTNPREYLRASVRQRSPPTTTIDMSDRDELDAIDRFKKSIVANYNHVRDILIRGIGVEKLTMSCRDELSTRLPILLEDSLNGKSSLWTTIFVWQTLCNSFQEGHRSDLISTRNEMLVSAAIAQTKGPLHLPVQLSDLDRSDRDAITAFETQAQTDWIEFGMNPVLDFQMLIHETSEVKRLEYFASMLETARTKFDAIATAHHNNHMATETPRQVQAKMEPQPKGAWFDDSLW